MSQKPKRENLWQGVAHSRIPHAVTDGPAWRVLTFSAKALFVDLRAKLRSNNNGNVNAVLSELKHRGWTSPTTLSKALRQLERMGFIAKTRQGGIAALSKVCTLYRFTDLPVYEHPKLAIPAMKETNNYLEFKTVAQAKAAISAIRNEKSKLQKVKLKATETVATPPFEATETVQGQAPKLQKLYKGNASKAAPAQGFQPNEPETSLLQNL